jgi:CheY-like chemotaxis protein
MSNAILWIDDDAEGLLRPLRRLLEKQGFLVDVALDYETAREKLSSKAYRAVLADVILPVLTGHGDLAPYLGVELLRDVRKGRVYDPRRGAGTRPEVTFAFLTVVPKLELPASEKEGHFLYFDKAHLLDPGAIEALASALRGERLRQR